MPNVQRFDRFEFDPASGELRDGDAVVRLEPQPAKVLALLAARPGEVVTREELRREVWPGEVFVDFERGLNYCVRRVRQALGDAPGAPRFVATLPKRGYRFLVPVQEAPANGLRTRPADGVEALPGTGAEDEATGCGPSVGVSARPRPFARAARWVAGLVLGAAVVVAAVLSARGARPARRAAVMPPSSLTVAVALFDNETGRRDLDRAAQVFTDVLVERLARGGPPWSVIGNAAILRRPRPFQNLADIGATLHAELVVLGQILPADRGLTVLVHLIRTGDQRHLWVGRFAVQANPSPADADRIGARVSAALAANVGERRRTSAGQ